MDDQTPEQVPARRIDRQALERIILRAAELQTRERDLGEGLTESDLLALGEEVGIPKSFLHQAMLEETSRLQYESSGLLDRLMGPSHIAAGRTISRSKSDLDRALARWMTEVELLTVKRRYADGTSWEARGDLFATIKRALGFGGRRYELARAKEIRGVIAELDSESSHVTLVADMSTSRSQHLTEAAVAVAGGAVAGGIAIVLGFALSFAIIPIALGAGIGTLIARSRLSGVEKMSVGLERINDGLERHEIKAGEPGAAAQSPLKKIADEIRKTLPADWK